MKISVILPVYNRVADIGAAITSVLDQTRPADEVIVVDDGSTDDLIGALAPYAGRIKYQRQDNAGVAAARNTGAAAATGDWLTFQDSDDLWSPDHLAVVTRDLAGAAADIVAHLGDVTYVGDGYEQSLFAIKQRAFPTDRAERVEDTLDLMISGMTLQGAAIRADVFARLGGFDTGMRMLSDTAFFYQLALQGPFLVTGQPIADIRRIEGDEDSITSLHRKNTLYARQMHVRALNALATQSMGPEQRHLTAQTLAGAEFRLAQIIHMTDPTEARKLLWRAAKHHPSPARGWIKSLLAATFGTRGYQLVINDQSLDRS